MCTYSGIDTCQALKHWLSTEGDFAPPQKLSDNIQRLFKIIITGIQWVEANDTAKCRGQFPTAKNYPTQNANSATVKKPCTQVIGFN